MPAAPLTLLAGLLLIAGCTVPGRAPAPPASLKVLGGFAAYELNPQARPPDAGLAVGPNSILVATNAWIGLYDKRGVPVVETLAPVRFFDAARTHPAQMSDPRALFDPRSRRFFVAMLSFSAPTNRACARAAQCRHRVVYAVSRGDSPKSLGPADWFEAGLEMTPAPGDTVEMPDFPSLAVTSDAVVTTLNMQTLVPGATTGNPYLRIRVFEKAAFVRDGTISSWHDLDTVLDPDGRRLYRDLQPALGADELWLMRAEDRGCRFLVMRVDDPLGAAAMRSAWAGSKGPCDDPYSGSQPGRTRSLDAGGQHLSSRPALLDGRLWAVEATRPAANRPSGIRWVALDVRAWPAVAAEQEGFEGAVGTEALYPAIVAGPSGAAAVVYAAASAGRNVAVVAAGRLGGDARGSLRPPAVLHRSEEVQDVREGDPSLRNRFGDYYDAALDPTDGTAWVTGEYIRTPEDWGMWVGHIAWRAG